MYDFFVHVRKQKDCVTLSDGNRQQHARVLTSQQNEAFIQIS